MLVAAGTLLGVAGIDGVSAQGGPAILIDGNAVVTGFSGASNAGGAAPANRAAIDLDGPAARIVDLQNPGAPPMAQLLNAMKPFTVTAGQVGQVFAVALDNASPPNIYVAATSAYGLPIVVPGAGGALVRAQAGSKNAQFMPGLFGPEQANGGPGSIWRIDGVTGAVTLFANVTLDDVPNSGPALGGLAFDAASNTLFTADRETGMIHRFDLAGREVSGFDHGEQGRAAAGMPAVPYDPSTRLDITSPGFQAGNPQTWGYAPAERRVYGLAVQNGRLFYAVADGLQIWSVAISADGSFGQDARVELAVSPFDAGSEISKITFDSSGTMLVAERPAPTGAFDFEALAKPGVGRVLRYRSVTAADGTTAWQPAPDEYALGFPGDLRNGNGGIAIGYGYTPDGRIDRGACSAFLWSTGEQLRKANDPALIAQLAAGGPANVDGLQGNGIGLVRPANVPPLATYFVDYDDKFDDDAARGHLGDVAIWRHCAGGQAAFAPTVEPEVVPFDLIGGGGFGECREHIRDRDWRRPGRLGEFERRCCDWQWEHHGNDREREWLHRCCEREWARNGNDRDWQRRCYNPPNPCPPGVIRLPDGKCCDPRYVKDGRCPQVNNPCPPGMIVLPNGQCCDPRYVKDGKCGGTPPNNPCKPSAVAVPNCPPTANNPPPTVPTDPCLLFPRNCGNPPVVVNDPCLLFPRNCGNPPSDPCLRFRGKCGSTSSEPCFRNCGKPSKPVVDRPSRTLTNLHMPTGKIDLPRMPSRPITTPKLPGNSLGAGHVFTPRAFGGLGGHAFR